MQLVDLSKFLFDSDYPFIHEIVIKEMIQGISKDEGPNEQECITIEHENAFPLFPLLKYDLSKLKFYKIKCL